MSAEMSTQTRSGRDADRQGLAFTAILLGLLIVYGLWLVALWPGILGSDSMAILWEVEQSGAFFSGKPVFWFFFVNTFYGTTGRVEVPIAIQLALTALVFARILAWCWTQALYRTTIFLGVFIVLAPRMLFAAGTLYPDGPFAVASASLLFELWLTLKCRRLSPASFCMLALTLPFALFARANGIVLLIPLLYALWVLRGSNRLRLGGLALGWCLLVAAGSAVHRSPASHGVLFPLVAFETVNFLQPRPMNLWVEKPRISARTLEVLNRHTSVETLLKFYDRDYWDTLYHRPDGPRLGGMSLRDKTRLIKEFLRYNLWQNLPAFAASRVNVFLVSALGQGGEVSMTYAGPVLAQTRSTSVYRAMDMPGLTDFVAQMHHANYRYRWLLWTPFVGIGLLFVFFRRAWQRGDWADVSLALPMLIQLAAIFLLSIAGEYRYLLPFFVLPMALLPALAADSRALTAM